MKKGDIVFVESRSMEYTYIVDNKSTPCFDGILIGKTRDGDNPLWLVEPLLNTNRYIPMVTVAESDIDFPAYPL